MSIHVEWMDAGIASAEWLEAGEEVVEDDPESAVPEGNVALVLSGDDVMVLVGEPDAMRGFLERLIDSLPEGFRK